jgi:hypothetical protein
MCSGCADTWDLSRGPEQQLSCCSSCSIIQVMHDMGYHLQCFRCVMLQPLLETRLWQVLPQAC